MPLMNVNFPVNAIFFYNLLMNMASLNILPSDDIESGMFTFDENPIPDNFELMDIF